MDLNKYLIQITYEPNSDILHYPISLNDFQFDFYKDIIGKGGFCKVYKALYKSTNKYYALKIIDKNSIENEEQMKNLLNELNIMLKLNHPNLLKLISHFEDNENIYIILPLASNGQLYDLIHKNKKSTKYEILKKYLYQCIEAIEYLHKNKIIHRDIKPENILIDDNDNAVLSDFGIATFIKEGEKRVTYCGTDEYLAPEIIRGNGYNEKIDIWAFGILIYECLSGKTPFNKIDFIKKNDDYDENIVKLKFDCDFDIYAKNLITKILRVNPEQRLSIEEIKNHIFFKNRNLSLKNEVLFNDLKKDEIELKLNFEIKNDASEDNNNTIFNLNETINSLEKEKEKLKIEIKKIEEEENKLKNNQTILENRIEILNHTIEEYKNSIEEKNLFISKLTNPNRERDYSKEIPSSLINNIDFEKKKLNDLIISSNEHFTFFSKNYLKYTPKDYLIKECDSFFLLNMNKAKKKEECNGTEDKGNDVDNLINAFGEIKKIVVEKFNKLEENIKKIKSLLEESNENFKEQLLNKCVSFNDILYKLKDDLKNNIENTINNINKFEIEEKNKQMNFLNTKNNEYRKIITEHETKCNPKIENLTLETNKWKLKFEDLSSKQINNQKLIDTLKEKIDNEEKEILELRYLLQNK